MTKLVVIEKFGDTTQALPDVWAEARHVRAWGVLLPDGDFVPLGTSPAAGAVRLNVPTGLYDAERDQATPADPDDVPPKVKVRFVKWTINQAQKGE